ncbi:uncharacterized protein KY384_006048 [Bacidia gigantensis]|uniref:uncharacterized protein n=1 Tax=Bacidia gigantensis TaxID=2732470 RepID=UPI001D03F8E7|nr:uncharacterized protein KY384_006048 [Bacidia gigantensis]KAG8529411.1 hypothetical protein KY384_006048 [Bacidia gigantensis]
MPCASGQNQKQSYVATFDDLTTLSLSLPNVNIPSSVLDDTISVDKASPVPYQGLDWSDFKSTKNLLAFSQPNVFSYQPSSPDEKSSDTDVSHSGPAPSNKFVPTGGKGAFALEEMYVACIANSTEDTNAQSNTTLSRRALQVRDFVANNHWLRARGIEGKVGESTCDSCSIVITGITSSGKSVQTASLSFSPSKRGMQKMAFTDDWKDLKQVSIGAESCGKASEVGIDNVKYEVMSDCQ